MSDNDSSQSDSVTVIGPECFASVDESVICWRGVNYYREPDDDELAQVLVAMEAADTVRGRLGRVAACARCGHPADRHMWFGAHPCGTGSQCDCPGYVEESA